MEVLLERGADRTLLDHHGKTAADYARARNYHRCLLVLTGISQQSRPQSAVRTERGDLEAVACSSCSAQITDVNRCTHLPHSNT